MSEERFHEMEQIASEYAKQQAIVDHLDEWKKSKLSLLMRAAEKNGYKTAAMQEREALADPEYIKLIEAKNIANEQAIALKWKLKLFEMRFEWARTKAANKRAEMSLR
jgi:hypothetical protein